MSRFLSTVLSWVSSFGVAYLVGSTIRDRQTGIRAGLVAATIAAVVSWVAYTVVEAVETRTTTGATREITGRDGIAEDD